MRKYLPTINKVIAKVDIIVPIFVISIIIIMILVPLPTFILDFLVIISLASSILIILITMFVKESLEFAVFPVLILLTTIYRLGLSIAITRAILILANAGRVVQAFGQFVTGGSYVVGFVIYAMIVIVNYVVVAHGAQRIGEVAARFTLDAMPGKQMSIDADLNSGLITDKEARKRRKNLEMEADYFGAMDGASRFVQRDSLAGIITTLINIGAGFIIGMVFHKLSAMEALTTYVVLTIGAGIVSQLPTLLISTATGIMVTNAATEAGLSEDIVKQTVFHPKPLAITSGILGFFGIVGLITKTFPFFPFIILSIITAGSAYILTQAGIIGKEKLVEEEKIEEQPKPLIPEKVTSLLHVDAMELEIGYGLIPLVDPDQKGDLLDRVTMIRRQNAIEMGIIVPPIRIRDNIQLKPNEYLIKIKGIEVAKGTIMVDHYLAMNPAGVKEEIIGIDTVEPAFGLPAKWISEAEREKAEMLGYTIVDPSSVIATHLTEIIRNNAHELLGRQETQELIDVVKEKSPVVVEELIPNILSLGEVQKVLQNLLRERISIRNLVVILETLADYAPITKDIDVLTEYVRSALARQICKQYQLPDGTLPVITLNPSLEDTIVNSLQKTETITYPVIPPETVQKIVENSKNLVEKAISMNYQPIILCSPRVRIYFRRLVERFFQNIVVLSHSEVLPEVKIKVIGMLSI